MKSYLMFLWLHDSQLIICHLVILVGAKPCKLPMLFMSGLQILRCAHVIQEFILETLLGFLMFFNFCYVSVILGDSIDLLLCMHVNFH